MANGDAKAVVAAARTQAPADNYGININDDRQVEATSGKSVESNFSGKYDPQVIKDIIEVAKQKGIDPYTFLSIGLQETGLGKHQFRKGDEDDRYPGIPESKINVLASDDIDWEGDVMNGVAGKPESEVRKAALGLQADLLKQKMKIANKLGIKDEAGRLQAYNGYGIISGKPYSDPDNPSNYPRKMYGVDVGDGVSARKNPLYGKRIIDLRENIIKKNSDIQKLVGGNDADNLNAIQNPDNGYVAQNSSTSVAMTPEQQRALSAAIAVNKNK